MTAMAAPGQPPPKKPSGADAQDEVVLTVPLLLDVSANLEPHLKPALLNDELLKIRRALYYDLGVPFPGIHLRYSAALPDDGYAILLHEVPVSQGVLRPGHLFVREREENLKTLGIECAGGTAFLPNLPTLWVPEARQDLLSKAGVGSMNLGQVLTYHLAFVLKKYAADFIGIQETRYLLASMEARFGELVKEVQRSLPLQKITEVLQRLVSEDVSIRNLRAILESLIDWGQKEKDTVLLTEYVRSSLRRYISYKYSSGHNMLPAYMFAPKVEEAVRNAIRQTSAGSYLALDTSVARQLVDNVKKTVGDLSTVTQRPCC